MKAKVSLWLARSLIGIVTILNLQAAVFFLLTPQDYAPGFELAGAVGNAMIQAMGLLFVMWNVPYIIAMIHPIKHRISLIEAVTMQGIGVSGETILLFTMPGNHPILSETVTRFIIFDGIGFLFLLFSLILARDKKERS